MDAIYKKITRETVTFNLGDEETWRELYEPLVLAPTGNIVVVRDVRYGPEDRNLLDVYYAQDLDVQGKSVMLFMHGGGFFSGDKAWSDKYWSNIGNHFAHEGLVVIIVNHQLVPFSKDEPENAPIASGIKYPAGANDVQLAREWVYQNVESPKYGAGSKEKVVLFGHSSGGAHIAANLYAAGDPDRSSSSNDVFPPVAGVIYLSVPFWYDRNRPVRQKILQRYYGSDAEDVWGPRSALGLFQRLPEGSPVLDAMKVPTYIGTVRWEVKEAFDAAVAFFKAYRERSRPEGTSAIFHVLDKHNHLSNVLSIGTADRAQADRLLDFVLSCTSAASQRRTRPSAMI
ncbi:Alpha/Beta hydrolase protein [Plectosphaerella cucumerina]|uniref:Alpha/Beta hydrolase protein n=1 Tax=Plectosphaerella cucumerina TaxID=40658 RepID=A0A8K0X5H1_9PEZI|nr:Alpha/Beta hydrolase protein [Plectosphaerella cucumerina]